MVLREKGSCRFVAEVVAAAVWCFLSSDQPAKGRFAGAVGANDSDAFAPCYLEVEVVKNIDLAIGFTGVFKCGNAIPRSERVGEAEAHHSVVLFNLDDLYFFKLLDAGLNLFGLGRFRAESIDEILSLFDFSLLGFVLLNEDFFTQYGFFGVEGIVARIFLSSAVVECDRACGEHVEQGKIVGDDKNRTWVVDQIRLHPLLGIDIQVVGRLVQEQDLWLHEQ